MGYGLCEITLMTYLDILLTGQLIAYVEYKPIMHNFLA